MYVANRYVAMCDILGFKNLIKVKTVDKIHYDYSGLLLGFNTFCLNGRVQIKNEVVNCIFENSIFSDTLLTWVNEEQGSMIHQLFFISLCKLIAISIAMRMPIRIGVAYGECCIDKENQIYVGRPIVDAFNTEQSQSWIGGAFHKSCLKGPDFLDYSQKLDWLINYEIPLKNQALTIPCNLGLNWPYYIFKTDYQWLKEFERENDIPDIGIKYKNAIKFIEFIPKEFRPNMF